MTTVSGSTQLALTPVAADNSPAAARDACCGGDAKKATAAVDDEASCCVSEEKCDGELAMNDAWCHW